MKLIRGGSDFKMIHSFLLIGQSNMAGRGFMDGVEPINNNKIKVLRNGRWQRAYRPINCDRPFSGVCLAESFAEAYVQDHHVDVGLIPCADGGTSLDQWKEGSLLYDHAISQAKLASRTSAIAGVLWHQGEAECEQNRYLTYRERLEKIIKAMRRELELDDVPFLIGGLGDFLQNFRMEVVAENYKKVNEALKETARYNELVGFVSAEGLTANPDNLHFNTVSLREFGLRYYQEFRKLENRNKEFVEKQTEDDTVRGALELL